MKRHITPIRTRTFLVRFRDMKLQFTAAVYRTRLMVDCPATRAGITIPPSAPKWRKRKALYECSAEVALDLCCKLDRCGFFDGDGK